MLEGVCAAILAGGLGTRLRSCVTDKPKVLADVAGRPFLSCLLDQLAGEGVSKTVLCTGYMSEAIEKEYGARYGSMMLCYSVETKPLGTAGALRKALDLVPSRWVLVLNGDSFCDTSLRIFFSWHEEKGANASMVLKEVDDAGRYGSVLLDSASRVERFLEKGKEGPGLINAGIYLLETALLNDIPSGEPSSLERDIFPKWAASGNLYGFCAQIKRFIDIGTPESYSAAQKLF